MSVKDALDTAKKNKAEIVDLKFVDFPGLWQHFSIPATELSAEIFEEGLGFDGSSIRGFQSINESEMVLNLEKCGVKIEVHHHEVGTAGQTEIDMRFTTLTKMADQVLLYKYVIKNTARKRDKVVTVMPKPLFQDNGSGMHTHQSLWKGGKNIFYDKKGYGLISDTARYYIGGLLKHAHALCGFIAPTTNSYRRLVPGYEAPINLVYSARNRSACVRIPMYSTSEKAKRL